MKEKIKRVVPAVVFALTVLNQNLWAMASRPNPDPNAPQAPGWVQWFPMLVMVAVFYLLLIRPQMKQKKERDQMLGALKKGDQVVTQGGFIVTIVNLAPDFADVKINEETKAKIRRSAIVEVVNAPAAAQIAEVVTR